VIEEKRMKTKMMCASCMADIEEHKLALDKERKR
jgi:hypothetical protein